MFSRIARPALNASRARLPQAGAAFGRRTFATASGRTFQKRANFMLASSGLVLATIAHQSQAESSGADIKAVRVAIADILDNDDWDDGSLGPVLIRLAWHASGTYSKADNTGGSDGATMRFTPESADGANAGLAKARAFLEPIKAKFPEISYADLWILAGYVAVEEMGGPSIEFRSGRTDKVDGSACPPVGRLPDAAQGSDHLRDVFYRQGFNDQEIVALSGAHAMGRCHGDRSGFVNPWTRAPTTFSSEYFRELLENTWTPKKWSGPFQLEDPTGDLMMLPTDMALIEDPKFLPFVKLYAGDRNKFKSDFAAAFKKLTENGCKFEGEASTGNIGRLAVLALLAAVGISSTSK